MAHPQDENEMYLWRTLHHLAEQVASEELSPEEMRAKGEAAAKALYTPRPLRDWLADEYRLTYAESVDDQGQPNGLYRFRAYSGGSPSFRYRRGKRHPHGETHYKSGGWVRPQGLLHELEQDGVSLDLLVRQAARVF